jgi:phosphatidylserine synthase
MSDERTQMVSPARIAIWALGIGAVVLLILIGNAGSDDLEGKVFAAAILFVLFSLSSLAGFLLIDRQPQLTFFGGMTIGLSVAAYFVTLDAFLSNSGFSSRHTSVGVLMVVVLAASQISMLLSFRREDDSPLVNATVFGSIAVLALLAVLGIVDLSNSGSDIGPKVYSSLAVLYLFGALLPPFLRWEEAEQT